MRQNRIYKVIQRLSGNITDEQRHMVWYWIFCNRNDADTETVMKRIWHESGWFGMDDHSLEQSLLAVKYKINNLKTGPEKRLMLYPVMHMDRHAEKKIPGNGKKRYWLAAACLVVLVSSLLLFLLNDSSAPSVKTGAFVGQTMPSDDIQLISGKNVLKLSQNVQIALNEEGKVSLVNDAKKSEIVLSREEMNRLIVPYGKRSTLELSDGTKVWMNSGSELEFPSEFKGNARDITLKGEIYLEVVKAENKPFYVHTSEFSVLVHGTRFNVSAYPDNAERTVVLVEGEVEVITAGQGKEKLAPDEMLTIDSDGVKKQKVDVTGFVCWKDGVLLFNKTPISEVLRKIGRYYNVSFDDHSDELLSSRTCTGKLYLSEDLDEVLMSVAILSKTTYFKRDGIIYIRNQLKLNE